MNRFIDLFLFNKKKEKKKLKLKCLGNLEYINISNYAKKEEKKINRD